MVAITAMMHDNVCAEFVCPVPYNVVKEVEESKNYLPVICSLCCKCMCYLPLCVSPKTGGSQAAHTRLSCYVTCADRGALTLCTEGGAIWGSGKTKSPVDNFRKWVSGTIVAVASQIGKPSIDCDISRRRRRGNLLLQFQILFRPLTPFRARLMPTSTGCSFLSLLISRPSRVNPSTEITMTEKRTQGPAIFLGVPAQQNRTLFNSVKGLMVAAALSANHLCSQRSPGYRLLQPNVSRKSVTESCRLRLGQPYHVSKYTS